MSDTSSGEEKEERSSSLTCQTVRSTESGSRSMQIVLDMTLTIHVPKNVGLHLKPLCPIAFLFVFDILIVEVNRCNNFVPYVSLRGLVNMDTLAQLRHLQWNGEDHKSVEIWHQNEIIPLLSFILMIRKDSGQRRAARGNCWKHTAKTVFLKPETQKHES